MDRSTTSLRVKPMSWSTDVGPRHLILEDREPAARAQDIEDAVYDLKAVNPNKQA